MTLLAPVPPETADDPDLRATAHRDSWRARIVVSCLVLVVIAFLQDPGRISADTKLDLFVSPWRFLGRSLHLWDEQGFFGQLQNQAYGYLWPMGPFFGVGDSAGLPVWVVQRLWWALLLIGCFLGIWKLAGALGIGSPWARLLAAFAYALSVRPQSGLGAISVEIWPMAVAPWVLLPLVRGARRGSPARAAALSALAVTCAGGVNAVAAGAVLPLALWWLLTLNPGPRRRLLLRWWLGLVPLAILWWLIPLVALGKYSPPFLDWIESAAYTTSVTDPVSVLRGASHWVGYLGSGVAWTAGGLLAASPWLIAASGLVAAAGVAGLASRSLPYRSFLLGGLAAGLVLVSLGHTGVAGGLGSEQLQDLMDGPLSPIRNVHKFDVVLRIPLVLGMAHLLGVLWKRPSPAWQRRVLAGVVVAAVALTAWPALTGQLARGRTWTDMADHWRDAESWLQEEGADGRALIVPGASFAQFLWGRTQDEPLQALGDYPWGVRDAVPLSSAGNIRMLDKIETRLQAGRPSAGLATFLSRMGVRYLVVRNDLAPQAGAPSPTVLHHALDASPGLNRVAWFGPIVGGGSGGQTLGGEGLSSPYPAVEIYAVRPSNEPADPRVVLRPADQVVTVQGAPESQLDMADLGLLGNRPVVLAADEYGPLAGVGVLTDSDRRREISFGYMRDNESPTMTSGQGYEQRRGVWDYRVVGPEGDVTAVQVPGRSTSASSSLSDVTSAVRWPRGATPDAALDGDRSTYWRPGDGSDLEAYWQVDYPAPVTLSDSVPVWLTGPDAVALAQVPVTVTTDQGSRTSRLSASSRRQTLAVPPGPTRIVRIALGPDAEIKDLANFGVREVGLPGVGTPGLRLLAASPDALLLSARPGDAYPCVPRQETLTCSPGFGGFSQDRTGLVREVDLQEPLIGDVRMSVIPNSAAVGRLIAGAEGLAVTASSNRTDSPGATGMAAFDRRLGTAWQAAPEDPAPTLSITLPRKQLVRGLRFINRPGLNASSPLRVRVRAGDRQEEGYTDSRGVFRFDPVRTDSLQIEVLAVTGVRNRELSREDVLPVGISEVALLGADELRTPLDLDRVVSTRCGQGPDIDVDGRTVARTRVRARAGDLLDGVPVPARVCAGDPVNVPAGRHTISVPSSRMFQPLTVALEGGSGLTGPSGRPDSPKVDTWDPTRRVVTVDASGTDRVLEVTENFNPGWTARLAGTDLQPIRLEGWKQGFVLPAGMSGQVEMRYAPDTAYRWGLLAGLIALLLVIGIAWRAPGRRELPAAFGRQLPRLGVAVLAAAALLVTGWGGLVVAAVACLGVARWGRAVVVAAVLTMWVPGPVANLVQAYLIAAGLGALAAAWWRGSEVDVRETASGSSAEPAAR